ncbi:MAG TPA: hypothetical protein VFG14_02025 [Chthoniobacteraceae bacterium]|nr:hypothetical protein [Chthoniobacteraceae bacterium]
MHLARLLAAICAAFFLTLPARSIEKWLYVATNLQVDENVGKLESLMERAAKAGYTHLLFADSKLARLGTLAEIYPRYARNTEAIKTTAKRLKIEVVPAIFHIGYSNAMLFHDPNLVEGMPVKDMELIIRGGIAEVSGEDVSLPGGDFSDLKKWSWKDDNVTPQDGAAHVKANGANGRIVQKLEVKPWHQYHVSVRVKANALKGANPEVKALAAVGGRALNFASLGAKSTQDWTTHHLVFNSQDQIEVNLFFGEWGANSGDLWWDDAKVSLEPFVNLIRRDGCPLAVQTLEGKALVEGRDFETLRDPLMGTKPYGGEYDVYHKPPKLRTKLPDGTRLRVSYYHAVTVYEGQAMVCPSEPRTMELLGDEAKRVHALWNSKGYMMSHDECRAMNWCAACEKRKLTPGQILADNVRACADILRKVNPHGRIYTWSDMFDPHHNAVKGPYYLVNGPLVDSWIGLDKDIIILPWYFEKRSESLKFFADRGHKQVIAGYYDHRPDQVKEWLSAAKATPDSVTGVMYTTWQNKYDDLEAFARFVDETR